MQVKRTLPSIPHLYRNMRRWTEILAVLSKYGLADWLSRLNVDFVKNQLRSPDGDMLARLTTQERIRFALSDLGPTFIKFGQLLSTRPDLVDIELATELSKLQAAVPADSFESVKKTIEQEQGRPLEEIFLSFNAEPLASASIGQVHVAKLLDGRKVIVKVRHSGIKGLVETDLDILTGLAQLAERSEDFRPYHPRALVREMSRTMPRELDFRLELRSQNQFFNKFENSDVVRIPRVFEALSTEKMLTMELMEGYKLTDLVLTDSCDASVTPTISNHFQDLDLPDIARNGANLYLQMIFDDGLYHADPHPGNIMIMPDGRIGLLDYGMVGRISEQLREDIEAMLLAIINSDVVLLVTLVKRVGSCPMDLNEEELSAEIADFVAHFASQSMSNFDMSGALNEFVLIVRRFQITLPGEAAMLIKVLVQLEGTGRLLDPQFSLMGIMRPFHRKLLLRRLSPARQVKKVRRLYMQMEQLADSLPQTISSILEQVKRGKFDVHLDHRRLGPSVNRLVLGMMTSALFLGSSLMLSREVPPLLFTQGTWMGIKDLSLLGLSGCVASVFLGVRLYLAIRHSGNLDE